jgi:membrane-bound lytic murein transglycosylase D
MLNKARASHRAKDYQVAVGHLDVAIEICNTILVTSQSRTVRNATGGVLRSSSSLRLACTLKLDRIRDNAYLVGPILVSEDDNVEDIETDDDLDYLPQGNLADEDSKNESPIDDDYPPTIFERFRVNGVQTDNPVIREISAYETMAWIELVGGDHNMTTEFDISPMLHDGYPNIVPVRNAKVQKWIDYFTGRGRKSFELHRRRAALYTEWMEGLLASEGLPPEIVTLVYVESGFNNQAVSRSRAVGQWQFIYGTGKLMGLRINTWVDDRRDPERATIAAARYLKHLYSIFGDWELALASYNCGEGRTIRTIAKQGTKNYWDLRLPRETRNYIPKFMAVLEITNHPERYGFDPLVSTPLAFDEIYLPGAVDLKAIAREVDVTLDSLKVLNPSYRQFAAPPGPSGVALVRVPQGTGEGLLAGLAAGDVTLPRLIMPKEPSYRIHRVRKGETLIGIAKRYRIRTRDLQRQNNIRNPSRLQIGQRLRVPDREAIKYASDYDRRLSNGTTSIRTASAAPSDRTYSGTKTIRISRGDTLISLASRYGTDVTTLRALNSLRPRQNIIAGAKLKVPVR